LDMPLMQTSHAIRRAVETDQHGRVWAKLSSEGDERVPEMLRLIQRFTDERRTARLDSGA